MSSTTINGLIGTMQINICPITGYKYHYQPLYRKLSRSERRQLKTERYENKN